MSDVDLYPYLVAAHVAAVVFLAGGMLAHNRMLSALAGKSPDGQLSTLEALFRFDRQVTTPALLLTWVFGMTLALSAGWFASGWLMLKLVVVVLLSVLHGVQSGRLRGCLRDQKAARNLPGASIGIVVAILAIAILAVAKPV